MSKIDELEQKMILQGMSNEDFAEYQKLLKRVRGNFLKRQHCYTTAIQFSPKYAEQAIELIRYGLDHFEDDWFSAYTSYLFMGHVYQKVGNYQRAYDSYLLAKSMLGSNHAEYEKELSRDLLWTKLHIDSFCYSSELEDHYSSCIMADDFSKSLINNAFVLAVAGIVIALHHENRSETQKWLDEARKLCQPSHVGGLHDILIRHRYREKLHTTPEAMAFLESIKL